jgi:hypothetical protein
MQNSTNLLSASYSFRVKSAFNQELIKIVLNGKAKLGAYKWQIQVYLHRKPTNASK